MPNIVSLIFEKERSNTFEKRDRNQMSDRNAQRRARERRVSHETSLSFYTLCAFQEFIKNMSNPVKFSHISKLLKGFISLRNGKTSILKKKFTKAFDNKSEELMT